MAVACPSSRVTTARRGLAGGGGVRRSPARFSLCASVPCSCLLGHLPCAASGRGAWHVARGLPYMPSTVSPAASAAGGAWGGDSGVSGASWSSLVAVPRAAAGVSRCDALPTACPPPGAASVPVPSVRSPEGVASGRRRWAGPGDAPRVFLPHPQTVPGPASSYGCLPGAQGAGCSRRASAWRWYRVAPGRRGREHHAARLMPTPARRPRA
jgi:hypothetical protein